MPIKITRLISQVLIIPGKIVGKSKCKWVGHIYTAFGESYAGMPHVSGETVKTTDKYDKAEEIFIFK